MTSDYSDPTVASRVRSLRLRSLFEDSFFWSWSRKYQGSSWKARARRAVRRLLHIPLPRWHHHKSTLTLSNDKEVGVSLHGAITLVADVLPTLSNISEFTISTMLAAPTLTYDMRPFYHSAFASFGSNLSKFSLYGQLEAFCDILHVSLHVAHLQELEMTFMDSFRPTVPSSNDLTLLQIIAPFINRHKATIQTLSLTSGSGTIDLSSLFLALDTFSSLRRIRLSFPRHYVLWSDLSGLARFLRNHADTLQHVVWSVTWIWEIPPPPVTPNLFFGTWLATNAITFRRLKTLSIETVDDTDLDAVLNHLRHSSSTLTQIHLNMNVHLSAKHVDNFFSVLYPSTRLTTLLLQIETFTPQLLLRLAEQMAGLRKLCLFVHSITPRSQVLVRWYLLVYSAFCLMPSYCLYSFQRDFSTVWCSGNGSYMISGFGPYLSYLADHSLLESKAVSCVCWRC
jgi:hypothetical protein